MNELEIGTREIIKEFGTTGVLDILETRSYSPETGEVEAVYRRVTALMYLAELTLQSNGTSLRYGTQVREGDREAYIIPDEWAGLQIAPGTTKLTFLGVTYTVAAVKNYEFRGKRFLTTAALRF